MPSELKSEVHISRPSSYRKENYGREKKSRIGQKGRNDLNQEGRGDIK